MELVKDVVSLKETIEKGKCPFKGDALKATEFFIQLAQVVEACEKPKIVHRDFSPGNILILPDLSIKVIDFGICQIDGATPVTLVDESVGTHNYMAPECENGAEGEITNKTDLYSAGKLLWSAVTGLRAFAREDAAYNAKAMEMMFPDNPATYHLHTLFEKTIRRDPANRFKSAADAIEEARRVRYRILNRYPPLEVLVSGMCPICSVGKLVGTQDPYNNNARMVSWQLCDNCGYRFVRSNDNVAQKKLDSRKQLN